MEGEERFEPALRDFGLIWSVRSVPKRILENTPLDHYGRESAVITLTDKIQVLGRAGLGENFREFFTVCLNIVNTTEKTQRKSIIEYTVLERFRFV